MLLPHSSAAHSGLGEQHQSQLLTCQPCSLWLPLVCCRAREVVELASHSCCRPCPLEPCMAAWAACKPRDGPRCSACWSTCRQHLSVRASHCSTASLAQQNSRRSQRKASERGRWGALLCSATKLTSTSTGGANTVPQPRQEW